MKKKSIFILLAIFVVFVVVAIIIEGPVGNRGKKKAAKESILFPGFNPDQIYSVEIITKDRNVKLSKDNDLWVVATADNYPADPSVIEEMLETAKDLKMKRIVSKSAEKYSQFRLDEEGVEVKMFGVGEDALAHFIVGKPGPDYVFSTYLRKVDRGEVLLVEGSIKSSFDKGSRGWRDREILKFDDSQVQGLTLVSEENGEISMQIQENGDWQIIKPEIASAKKDAVDRIVRGISDLSADDFAEKKELKEYKLDEPLSKVIVDLKDGTSRILLVGDKSDRQYYVKSEGKDTVFMLSESKVDRIFKSLEDLKAEVEEVEEEAEEPEQSKPEEEPS